MYSCWTNQSHFMSAGKLYEEKSHIDRHPTPPSSHFKVILEKYLFQFLGQVYPERTEQTNIKSVFSQRNKTANKAKTRTMGLTKQRDAFQWMVCRWEQEITYGGRRDCLLYDWLPDEKKHTLADFAWHLHLVTSWHSTIAWNVWHLDLYLCHLLHIACCNMQVLEWHFGKKINKSGR